MDSLISHLNPQWFQQLAENTDICLHQSPRIHILYFHQIRRYHLGIFYLRLGYGQPLRYHHLDRLLHLHIVQTHTTPELIERLPRITRDLVLEFIRVASINTADDERKFWQDEMRGLLSLTICPRHMKIGLFLIVKESIPRYSAVDMRLFNQVQERRKNKSVDWDSHFNLESLFGRDEYSSKVDEIEGENNDDHLEKKILKVDY